MVISVKITNPPGSGLCFINVGRGAIPPYVFENLDNTLSDYVKNFEWTEKFKSGEWDGKYHLFKKASSGSWYFPIGYLNEVVSYLQSENIEIDAINLQKPNWTKKLDISWNSDKIELRKYQRDIIEKIIDYNAPCTIQIPTGAGKTAIALNYASILKRPFLVVVHRKELLYQWKSEIEAMFGVTPTIIGDGRKDWSGDIVVAMVQTLHKIVKSGVKLAFPLIIFDECHTLPASEAYSTAMSIGARWRLGLSATARREDNKDKMLWGATGSIICSLTVPDLVKKGYLIEPIFRLIEAPYPSHIIGNREKYANVYKYGIVHNSERNKKIFDEARKGVLDGRKTYIHVRHIRHGELLNREINGSVFIHGNSKDRESALEAFKRGEIPCLISTLLKEGVNVPIADKYINAAGGASYISTIQTAGRTLRTAENKENTIIVDFIDNAHKFLEEHTRMRFDAYKEVYEEYFDNAEVIGG